MPERMSQQRAAQVAHAIRRLAFVNGWSDALIEKACCHWVGQAEGQSIKGADAEELLTLFTDAAEDLNLASLRGGSEELTRRGAKRLGFVDGDELHAFIEANPMLSEHYGARPAAPGMEGVVYALSSTEVILKDEHGFVFFDRCMLPFDAVSIGQTIRINQGGFGCPEILHTGRDGDASVQPARERPERF